MTQTMRERLIAAAAKADRETCTEDVDWQPVTNWPEVIDAILDVLREPDEGMSEAGARAVSAEWPPKSGKRGDALVDTGREGEVSEEWQIKQFDADDAFTAMIDHVREREAVSDLPTKWNGDAEPGAAVAMITLKSDGPLFPAGKPTPRNPALMLRDYVRENFPADMIAPDFDEQIEVLAAELDKPADHVRAGR